MTRNTFIFAMRLVLLVAAALVLSQVDGWTLVIPALAMPPLAPPPSCNHCTSPPSSFQVIISGYANQTCTDCTLLNGTYITDTFVDGATDCVWGVVFTATPICDMGVGFGATQIIVRISPTVMNVTFQPPTSFDGFTATGTGVCTDAEGATWTPANTGTRCDGSGATCVVTVA